eukprot:4667404-Amphidinium_carterae.1
MRAASRKAMLSSAIVLSILSPPLNGYQLLHRPTTLTGPPSTIPNNDSKSFHPSTWIHKSETKLDRIVTWLCMIGGAFVGHAYTTGIPQQRWGLQPDLDDSALRAHPAPSPKHQITYKLCQSSFPLYPKSSETATLPDPSPIPRKYLLRPWDWGGVGVDPRFPKSVTETRQLCHKGFALLLKAHQMHAGSIVSCCQ